MLCVPPALQVRDFLKKLTIHRCIKTCTGREEIPGPRWPTETWDSLPLLLSKQSMKEGLGEIEMCSLKLGGIRLLPMLLKGIQLLAAQKPINRPGWWEGKFALFQMLTTQGEGGHLSKGWLPPLPLATSGARTIIDRSGGGGRVVTGWGEGLHAQTAVISDSHLQTGHQWSDQCHSWLF